MHLLLSTVLSTLLFWTPTESIGVCEKNPDQNLEFFFSVDGTGDDDFFEKSLFPLGDYVVTIWNAYHKLELDSKWSLMRAGTYSSADTSVIHRRVAVLTHYTRISANLRILNKHLGTRVHDESAFFQELVFAGVHYWQIHERNTRRIFSIWTYTKPQFGEGYHPENISGVQDGIQEVHPADLPTETQVVDTLKNFNTGLLVMVGSYDQNEAESSLLAWTDFLTKNDIIDSMLVRLPEDFDKTLAAFEDAFWTMTCPTWTATTTTRSPTFSKEEVDECMKAVANESAEAEIAAGLEKCLKSFD